jgi:hypothetical protein
MRIGTVFLVLLIFFPTIVAAREKKKAKAVYCVRANNGEWYLQKFEPLINPKAGTIFSEISFIGKVVDEVRLRQFHPYYELVYEYKYDDRAKLIALLGSIDMWGQWLGEADLYPQADGTVGDFHVKYYKSGTRDQIQRPEDAETYTAELSKVPLYRTIESLPCAGSLQEAEKMNATQE